jgi:hypothetical protein
MSSSTSPLVLDISCLFQKIDGWFSGLYRPLSDLASMGLKREGVRFISSFIVSCCRLRDADFFLKI